MSKPSQRTKDCRPVGRSGNRENRPHAHIWTGRAQRQRASVLALAQRWPSTGSALYMHSQGVGEEQFSFSDFTQWLLVPVRSCTEPGPACRPRVDTFDAYLYTQAQEHAASDA